MANFRYFGKTPDKHIIVFMKKLRANGAPGVLATFRPYILSSGLISKSTMLKINGPIILQLFVIWT